MGASGESQSEQVWTGSGHMGPSLLYTQWQVGKTENITLSLGKSK